MFIYGNKLLLLVIMSIEDSEKYRKKKLAFNKDTKKCHGSEKCTFMTKTTRSTGSKKTFCLRCIRCYVPKIGETTLEGCNLGLVILAMYDFEQRTNESRNEM